MLLPHLIFFTLKHSMFSDNLLFQMWPAGGAAGRVSETQTGGLRAEAECRPTAGSGGEGCCGPAAKSPGKCSNRCL